MAIEMNFGWLNDYTGSKFAPITLANLVLLDTSSGSTETLFDFVDSENRIIKAFLSEHDLQIGENKTTLVRLTHEIPFDPIDTSDTYLQELKPMAAQRAVRLVGAASDGECDWTDNENHIIGINKGDKNIPVFFKDGIPEQCYPGNTTIKLESQAYPDIIKSTPMELVYVEKYKTEYALTDGNASQALNANITGVAGYALQAWDSVRAEYATTAGTTLSALSTKKLDFNIEVGTDYETNDTTVGDIQGTIYTASEVAPGANLGAALTLREVLGTGAGTFGAVTYPGITTFTVPKITVDTKGRITKIEDIGINPKVALTAYDNSNVTMKQAPLVGYQGTLDNPSLIGFTNDASKGIYVDWSAADGIPVIMGAAWNDYAEYRAQKEKIEPGYCVKSNDDGRVERTTERLSICDGIVSDTFGFSIGQSDTYQTPLAVSGRVLAYCEGNRYDYHAGDVVCASENGKVTIMTRDEISKYPDRIVGTVSEIPNYEEWNEQKINGRIWIKVK